MLSRIGLAPLDHLAKRLGDVKRVSLLSSNWASGKSLNRRTSSHMRYKMPWRVVEANRAKRAAAAAGTGTKKKKPLVRKAHKRVLRNVLPASHQYLAKRMKMEDAAAVAAGAGWFGVKTALHSRARALESSLQLCQQACVLRDLSHEVWFSIHSSGGGGGGGGLDLALGRLFDSPNNNHNNNNSDDDEEEEEEKVAVFESNLLATELMMHELDSFPGKPLGPARLWRVSAEEARIAVHPSCADACWRSLEQLQRDTSSVRVARLDGTSTFILIGKTCKQVYEHCSTSQQQKAAVTAQSEVVALCCPLTNEPIADEHAYAKLFFSKQFGVQLQHGLVSLEPGQVVAAEVHDENKAKRMKPTTEQQQQQPVTKFDLVLGRKKATQMDACLVVVMGGGDAEAKALFLRLAKRVSGCIGQHEYELLCLHLHLPSFPRDYPDTPAHDAYWQHHAAQQSAKWSRLPRSKRGVKDEPRWQPRFVARTTEKEEDEGAVVVVRGWHYIKDFVAVDAEQQQQQQQQQPDDDDEDEEEAQVAPPPPPLVRVFVKGPRSNRFGARFRALDDIYLPSAADYANFTAEKKHIGARTVFTADEPRQRIGQLSSARTTAQESFGIGHVSLPGYQTLLRDCAKGGRKNTARQVFVLIKRADGWGVGFLSLF